MISLLPLFGENGAIYVWVLKSNLMNTTIIRVIIMKTHPDSLNISNMRTMMAKNDSRNHRNISASVHSRALTSCS